MSNYHQRRKRRKSYAGIIAVLFVVITIVIGCGIFALTMVSNTTGKTVNNAGISINSYVSGNDIAVDILGGGESSNLVSIELILDGYTLPPGYSVKFTTNKEYPQKIIYENAAKGIYDNLVVSYKGTFSDGSSKIIWKDTIRFT